MANEIYTNPEKNTSLPVPTPTHTTQNSSVAQSAIPSQGVLEVDAKQVKPKVSLRERFNKLDKNGKSLVLAGLVFIVILILLLLTMAIKGRGSMGNTPLPERSSTPESSSTPAPADSLEGRLRLLNDTAQKFELEDLPLLPPEMMFEIEVE